MRKAPKNSPEPQNPTFSFFVFFNFICSFKACIKYVMLYGLRRFSLTQFAVRCRSALCIKILSLRVRVHLIGKARLLNAVVVKKRIFADWRHNSSRDAAGLAWVSTGRVGHGVKSPSRGTQRYLTGLAHTARGGSNRYHSRAENDRVEPITSDR